MINRHAFASLGLSLVLLCGCATERSQPIRGQLTDEQPEEIAQEQTEEVLGTRDVVVCRYEVETGSHFRTKRCRTVQQIQEERRDGREAVERRQRTSGGTRRTD